MTATDQIDSSGIIHPGHVGLYVQDLPRMLDFYANVLKFKVTDGGVEDGIVFLSPRPDYEHHMLVLIPGRDVARDGKLLQQLSFRVGDLADVLRYRAALVDYGAAFDKEVSHGNAVGMYFYDPEGNRVEVYWPSGITATQPFVVPIDLTQDEESIHAQLEQTIADRSR